ncbi:MAG TPA: hypothetical protein VG797_08740, partial [Phycisphaerales bacterium]|nr:hypothetical protein [Phycisphaerales bacterium]
MCRRLMAMWGASVLPLTAAAFAAEPLTQYEVVRLGSDGPRGTVVATAISDNGHVSGYGPPEIPGDVAGALWWEPGTTTALELPSEFSLDVNASGMVVGTAEGTAPFRYENGVFTVLLGPTGQDLFVGVANGVNEAGIICGRGSGAGFPSSNETPIVWLGGLNATVLGSIGDVGGEALDINNQGEIVGYSAIIGIAGGATLWRNGQVIDMDPGLHRLIHATAINESSQIVGFMESAVPGFTWRGYLWQGGSFIDLGTHGPGTGSLIQPQDINEWSMIVGATASSAFLWEGGMMRDLETMLAPGSQGWQLDIANGINNRGEIVGSAHVGPGGSPGGAVLLRPLPVIA